MLLLPHLGLPNVDEPKIYKYATHELYILLMSKLCLLDLFFVAHDHIQIFIWAPQKILIQLWLHLEIYMDYIDIIQ